MQTQTDCHDGLRMTLKRMRGSVDLDKKISSLMDRASLSHEGLNVLDGEAMSTLCMCYGVKVLAISDENTEYRV